MIHAYDNSQNNADLMALLGNALAHLPQATPAEDKGYFHVIAERAGLTIHFHDSQPACDCCPPLAVAIYDDASEETVFMGQVDPNDPSNCLSDHWQRGDWENKLKHLN